VEPSTGAPSAGDQVAGGPGARWSAGSAGAVPAGWRLVAPAVDELLEATVVGSFSKVGIATRRSLGRLAGTWEEPESMAGRVAVVTGGTSGIGLAAAVALAGAGATVHLVGRRPGPAEAARQQVAEAARPGERRPPPPRVSLADLADADQVRRLAQELADTYEQLDVLVHGAGALSPTYTCGPQGTETTVAVGVLAPFALTQQLVGSLSRADGARVIVVSSGGLYARRFDLAALEPTAVGYDGVAVYAAVKRAQQVLAQAWADRLRPLGVAAYAMHPGWVDTPGLRQGLPTFAQRLAPILRSPADGADTVVWLACRQPPPSPSGSLWHDRRRRLPDRVPWTWVPSSRRRDQAAALWAWCAAQPAWGEAATGPGDGEPVG